MEVQTECSEPPPCDPQPTGKLNKTAFKLFGRRKSGSSMQSIFSVRNKGEATGKATSKPQELVRSKTHDGLITDTPSELDGHRKEESASADQLQAGMPDGVSSAPLRSSITRSFSFFSLLRRSSSRAGDGVSTVGRRGRGLKGLFSSMRWRRKPQAHEDSGGVQEVAKEVKEGDPILSPDSMKTEKEDITLTLEPLLQVFEDSPLPGDAGTWKGTSMQELQGTNEVECGRHFVPLSSQHIVTEESPALPLRVQAGGLQHDKHSDSAHLSSIPTCALTPPMEHSTADPPSEQSVDRLCSLFTDVTSLKSFDSLTGCGDIIADPEEDSGNGGSATSSGMGCSSGGCMGRRLSGAGTNSERCSPAKPPLPPQVSSLASIQASCYMSAHQRARPATKKPQGSGVVAYMGGGEEMASPEGVDDEDMQGLWHMLPQKGEDSPAPLCAEPVLHHVQTRLEKRPPPVKGLQGLSKIPGSCKIGKQQPICPSLPPVDKELQDAPPSDEGYWDSPTPGPDDEDSGFHRRDGLLRDSCSGDALYDLYDPDSPSAVGSDDDVSSPTKSAGDLKISLPSKKCSSFSTSSFRSMKGSTSLPRDSKIPISVKQTPPSHSSSQGALSSNLSPTSKSPSNKTDAPPRTRIPVSKLPVRRSGNKSSPSKQSRK